ncbi:phosphatidylinositol 3,4,5-trisphosphate 3-phosphatase TPTE2 [Cricetulus griseus]|uniref:Phosphatidylinositol 3,4,5-trisphosphate 3-phosphatase TPTE2 n=1 Tax=Cricetulus griseus TaxID=10029 RepID=A0A9J7J6A0_CRIGR|nr:phosphatidylinositol 3,4,5-trisphosphate 3-phosphatase TPTE2 [Cricetulus griseus]XP_027251193.1 phosphatidylinositol 3,4,5-trisphosphate 3-phosphatase TPTE2 [Cricetulus griseus]
MLSGVVTAAGNKRIKEALGKPDVSTVSSGLKTVCSTVSTSILIASSDITSDIQEESINKSKLRQVSKFYDGDECIDIRKTYHNTIKEVVLFLVSSVAFRVFGIMLIFLDIVFVSIDLHLVKNQLYIPLEYRSVSFAIALFFLVDVLLRVYVEGRQQYFSDLLNTLDAVVIGVTVFIAFTYIFYDKKFLGDNPRLAVLFRPLWLLILVRILQLAHQKRHLEKLTRRLVSGNKRRYKKDGFDLDLTYVTERIIAMSFPSSGRQSFYRNPIKEVVRFLDTKHPNHYQVYNLCSENSYDPKYFHYRVRRIMIDDHNVPTLEEMLLFSKEVNDWMAQHPENVVAIHCKGGKGRTGTMVCACLIASEIVLNAKESLYFFGERRTDKASSSKFQGVETPSQNRYVKYFEKLKISYQWTLPARKMLMIKRFILYSIHGVGKGDGSDLEVQVVMWQETVFSCFSSKNCMIFHDVETDRVIINVFNCPALYDDVKVKFLSPNLPSYYDDCPFFFWFHTAFIRNNRLYLPRHELDNTHKSKTWKIYSPKFAVEVYFAEPMPRVL